MHVCTNSVLGSVGIPHQEIYETCMFQNGICSDQQSYSGLALTLLIFSCDINMTVDEVINAEIAILENNCRFSYVRTSTLLLVSRGDNSHWLW